MCQRHEEMLFDDEKSMKLVIFATALGIPILILSALQFFKGQH